MQAFKFAGGKALAVVVCIISLSSPPIRAQVCNYFEIWEVTAFDADEQENFGVSIAIDGDWFVVGASQHDHATINDGAGYVYRRRDLGTPDPWDDVWISAGELLAWGPYAGGKLGLSVTIYGDWIVAGAAFHNGACGGESGCASGAAYAYSYTGTSWAPRQRLVASDQAEDLRFGRRVSINGNWLAVGSVLGDGWDAATGAAYLFRLDDNGTPSDPSDDFWVEHVKLTTPADEPDDRFGHAVALRDDRLVVAAPSFIWGAYPEERDAGAAYVYHLDDNGTPTDAADDLWVYEARLAASDGAADLRREFGWSVAISGDLVLVGAYLDDEAALSAGAGYLFRCDDNGTPSDPSDDFWFQEVKLIPSDAAFGDEFGISVGLSGDRAVLGGMGDDTIVRDNVGSVVVFRYVGGRWVQEQKFIASDSDLDGRWGHELGRSVAIDGQHVVAGAMKDDTATPDGGSAYAFVLVDDCNTNCIPDDQDIADCPPGDLSCQDCNGNGIPDGCEDCNGNGLADSCDIDAGTSQDCTNNGIPDECEPDCNGNGMADSCDIDTGASQDCNANRVPDECETESDCNGDGVPDECDVAAGACTDDCECDDRLGCTWDLCIDGLCIFEPSAYGDADHNDTINIFDLLCVLAGFAGDFGTCTFGDDDIAPCAGNGTIDIFDLLAILNAFAGQDPCCGG